MIRSRRCADFPTSPHNIRGTYAELESRLVSKLRNLWELAGDRLQCSAGFPCMARIIIIISSIYPIGRQT